VVRRDPAGVGHRRRHAGDTLQRAIYAWRQAGHQPEREQDDDGELPRPWRRHQLIAAITVAVIMLSGAAGSVYAGIVATTDVNVKAIAFTIAVVLLAIVVIAGVAAVVAWQTKPAKPMKAAKPMKPAKARYTDPEMPTIPYPRRSTDNDQPGPDQP
jgi:hypothetical protein